MGEETKIEWTDHSWSPWFGCSKISPGCAHCYAANWAHRFGKAWGRGTERPSKADDKWEIPRRWNRKETKDGRRVTVFPSMVDWLDEDVPVETFARFLQLIRGTPNLTWLLLTKRPENFMPRLERAAGVLGKLGEDGDKSASDVWGWVYDWIKGHPPLSVWVGTSVEDQPRADQRIPALLRIHAVGRFLSVEPLLGPVELPLAGNTTGFPKHIRRDGSGVGMPQRIQWVIIGGESGPGARPCNIDWVRSLVRQCKDVSVPPFVKQLGARPVEEILDQRGGHLGHRRPEGITHPKGGDPSEWPEDIRVREFPEGLR